MATILEKDVTRESTVLADNRNIQVTLTKDQEISFKLKGMKSGMVKISIEKLYNQLANIISENIGEVEKIEEIPIPIINKRKYKNEDDDETRPMINLHDFRSRYIIAGDIPLEIKVKLESITVDLIDKFKNK